MKLEKYFRGEIIKDFYICELGIDFMGYTFEDPNELSYHHLIIPKREHGETSYENGAVLVRDTSHNYIHTIERYDWEVYESIKKEIIEQKNIGEISVENLKRIREYLEYFEEKYINTRTSKGNLIIPASYIRKRIELD